VITLLDTARLKPLWSVQQCGNLGLAYARKENLAEASSVLRDGVNTYPDSMALAQKLADVLTQMGNKYEAVQVLAVAQRRQPAAKPDAP
jgi:predicted Zn-dependent protease